MGFEAGEQPKGVRLGVMRSILEQASKLGARTTTEVCQQLIIPATEASKKPYIELLDASDVGNATVFISHAWKYPLAHSVNVMEQYEQDHPNSFYWFDLVLNSQHGTAERPFEWWCKTFQESIEKIGAVVLVASPFSSPIPLTRSWCLFEIMCALNGGDSVTFEIRMPQEEKESFLSTLQEQYDVFQYALGTVKTQASEAYLATDKDNIFRAVEQSIGFQALNAKVSMLMRHWLMTVASEACDQIDVSAQTIKGFLGGATVFRELGRMFLKYGNQTKALELLRKDLERMEEEYGDDHKYIVPTLNYMASAFVQLHDLESALQTSQRALDILEHGVGLPTSGGEGPCYTNMGDCYFALGRYDEAKAMFTKAYGRHAMIHGQFSDVAAMSLCSLAKVALKQDDLAKAHECYQGVALVFQVGMYHPDGLEIASVNHDFGEFQLLQGDKEEAKKYLQQALVSREKILGLDHPDTMQTSRSLAQC
eukprot:m.37472 g.37472  ORF g.37472 m.37472 type:complete len:480 (+) comp10098_c0_seq1:127-1566(+)